MRTFWDERQRLHNPEGEFFNGAMHRAAESPSRVDAVLEAIGRTEEPDDAGIEPLLRVHSSDYLDFLQTAHCEWLEAGRTGDAFPYTFPLVGRRTRTWNRIDAKFGNYSFDTSTPIMASTWTAAYWSAQTALSAVREVVQNEGRSFALCRPPGHHSGRDYCGGYCYLNNAAIAAQEVRAAGKRVAILDVDYHHGNGTQDLVQGREGIVFASIHADPTTDYPFFWGHDDESRGNILNLPLPRGTDWDRYEPALDRAIGWIEEAEPDLLILSFGVDTHESDPISHFRLKSDDYRRMGRRIAALGLPAAIIMEGGYAVDALGANVTAFLSGL